MRVLIVDDEPLAQTALANILSARSDVEHFDSANDASEALKKLDTGSYDVLLLDINVLDLESTQLVDQLRERHLPLPSIVFVTAHVEHAVAAFERHTVDYVLKPFSNERISEAVDRAFRRAKGERAAKLIEALPHLQKLSSPAHPMIAIKAKGRILFINPGDVVAVQAESNYVSLQRKSDSYLLRESISMVAEKLKPYGFIRIHRSALVNPRLWRRSSRTRRESVDRARSLHFLARPRLFGLTLNEKQIPQIVGNNRNQEKELNGWSKSSCTQGRWTWVKEIGMIVITIWDIETR